MKPRSGLKNIVTDSLGRPVRIGSHISYPVRKGSAMWMEHGIVDSFELVSKNQYARVQAKLSRPARDNEGSDGRLISFSSFDRAVVTA